MKGRGSWPFIDLLPKIPVSQMVPGDIIIFKTALPDLLISKVKEPDGRTRFTWFEIGSNSIHAEVLQLHADNVATYSVLKVLRSQ
jgi:hypothetical protein